MPYLISFTPKAYWSIEVVSVEVVTCKTKKNNNGLHIRGALI